MFLPWSGLELKTLSFQLLYQNDSMIQNDSKWLFVILLQISSYCAERYTFNDKLEQKCFISHYYGWKVGNKHNGTNKCQLPLFKTTSIALPCHSRPSIWSKRLNSTLNKLSRCATTPRCKPTCSWPRPSACPKSRSEDQRSLSNAWLEWNQTYAIRLVPLKLV